LFDLRLAQKLNKNFSPVVNVTDY